MLPRQQIRAVYSLHESMLNVHRVQDETMQMPWVFPDRYLLDERLQFNVVRHQLTQNIPNFTTSVAAEIEFGFARSWGHDTEWRCTKVWGSALRIVAGAANGVFCGQPLCKPTLVYTTRVCQNGKADVG